MGVDPENYIVKDCQEALFGNLSASSAKTGTRLTIANVSNSPKYNLYEGGIYLEKLMLEYRREGHYQWEVR